MVKHTQTIRRQKLTNCLSVFDHFVKLALKGLNGMLAQKLNYKIDYQNSIFLLRVLDIAKWF